MFHLKVLFKFENFTSTFQLQLLKNKIVFANKNMCNNTNNGRNGYKQLLQFPINKWLKMLNKFIMKHLPGSLTLDVLISETATRYIVSQSVESVYACHL